MSLRKLNVLYVVWQVKLNPLRLWTLTRGRECLYDTKKTLERLWMHAISEDMLSKREDYYTHRKLFCSQK